MTRKSDLVKTGTCRKPTLLLFAIAHTFLGNPEARRAEDVLHRVNVMVNMVNRKT